MRKILAVTIFLLLFIPYAISAEFWAPKKSNKYHYPDCRWAQKIKPENLIKFQSPEEAQKAGYIPCKVCRPPISSKSELNTDVKPTLIQFQTNDSEERRGCCSWHGGVCGCDYSTCRVICCDRTLSPTCTCC
jgi:methylphosphotriester-DNA--protein-cysteine methyltransferase